MGDALRAAIDGGWALRARAKIISPFIQPGFRPSSSDLRLHQILAIGLKRACYSSGFAPADQTNLTQIRAPKLRKLFLREP
jgi:hypothetical protein